MFKSNTIVKISCVYSWFGGLGFFNTMRCEIHSVAPPTIALAEATCNEFECGSWNDPSFCVWCGWKLLQLRCQWSVCKWQHTHCRWKETLWWMSLMLLIEISGKSIENSHPLSVYVCMPVSCGMWGTLQSGISELQRANESKQKDLRLFRYGICYDKCNVKGNNLPKKMTIKRNYVFP